LTRKEGVVLKGTGGIWHVRAESGEIHEASLRGRLKQEREESKKLAVGDRVILETDERGSDWAIAEILPRHSQLARRAPGAGQGERIVAANVDQVVVVLRRRQAGAASKNAGPVSCHRRGKFSSIPHRHQQDRARRSRRDGADVRGLRPSRLSGPATPASNSASV